MAMSPDDLIRQHINRAASTTAAWQLLQALADKALSPTRRALVTALARAAETTPALIARDAAMGLTDRVIDGINTISRELGRSLRAGRLPTILFDLFSTAGRQSNDLFAPLNTGNLRAFDEQTGALITGLETDTRDSLLAVLRRGIDQRRQMSWWERHLLGPGGIGLTDRQHRALDNYESALRDGAVDPALMQRRLNAYREQLLKYRVHMIARTETIRSTSLGQHQALLQMLAEGDADPSGVRRHWLVTPDDRLCPSCQEVVRLNPRGRGVHEPFQTAVGPVMFPPLHPNCRCAVVVRRS